MKTWIIAVAMVAILGMSGFADAKGKHGHGHGGLHGKIESVSGNSFTMTVGGKKNPHSLTVNTANATVTIDGVAGKIDASLVGKHCSVTGSQNGDTVTASTITISTKGHAKKKAA